MKTSTSSDDLHLQQLKWPIEYLFVGAKVRDYFSPSDSSLMRQNLDVWDRFSAYTDNTYSTSGQNVLTRSDLVTNNGVVTLGVDAGVAATSLAPLLGTALLNVTVARGDIIQIAGVNYNVAVGAAAGAAVTGVRVVYAGTAAATAAAVGNTSNAYVFKNQGLQVQTKSWAPTLDTISIQAHGIDIYKEFPAAFFNAYTTYHYGGPNINAPQDIGSLFVPFCLYPGSYQPSGHINVSRAREFFLKYTSSYFGNNATSGLLIVIASAINFLLISDGSAVLRYST